MQMDDRKMRVLTAVIEVYTHTGEPVGSKLVSEQMDVSSATVRNEMAALFNMGLLEQPHTSAGRLPSYTGYRLYLDQLMQTLPLTPKERGGVDALFNVRDPDPDKLLEDAAQALAQFTGCAAYSHHAPRGGDSETGGNPPLPQQSGGDFDHRIQRGGEKPGLPAGFRLDPGAFRDLQPVCHRDAGG